MENPRPITESLRIFDAAEMANACQGTKVSRTPPGRRSSKTLRTPPVQLVEDPALSKCKVAVPTRTLDLPATKRAPAS